MKSLTKTLELTVLASALAINTFAASNNYMSDHAAGAKTRVEKTTTQDINRGTITVVSDGRLIRKEGYADFNRDGKPDYFTVKFNYGALSPSDANYVITTYVQNANGAQIFLGRTTYPGNTRSIIFRK